jgi:Leucine-rich repeat (LRR) protein
MPGSTRIIIVLLALIVPAFWGSDHELKAQVDSSKVYKSIKKASENPCEVFHLKLKWNRYESFPIEIFQFKNLISLNLDRNRIDTIPDEISNLKSLERLSVEFNNLVYVSPKIAQLNNLKELKLGDNEIATLPESMGKLQNLEILSLWSNNIVGVPGSFKSLSTLKTVDLRHIRHTEAEQGAIRAMLPNDIELRFSTTCNCD